VEAMQHYKELIAANESLTKFIPRIRERSCTYQKDEIFIIENTGARVSIDGSLDLVNMIIQKLGSKFKVGKLTERYQEERAAVLSFKCEMSLKVQANLIEITDSKMFSTKLKSKSYSALKLIESLYDLGYLDYHLNVQTEVFNTKKKEDTQRQIKNKEFKEFKDVNKAKKNKEQVVDVEFK
jgi:hypothetical protein